MKIENQEIQYITLDKIIEVFTNS